MPMVSPTLNLPQSSLSSTASTKAGASMPLSAALPATTPAPATSIPSTTVTLSAQAMSALAAANHPAASPPPSSSTPSSTPAPAPEPQDSSIYDSLKNGIAAAVGDVGDAIEGGAHAAVDGVETVLSTVNDVAKGILELPFAAVAKACDAAGDVIDAF